MIAAAEVVAEHYDAAAATMRRHYSCSVHDFGTRSLTWREATALLRDAIDDSATPLGAELREWTFRASRTEENILNALVALLSQGKHDIEEKNKKALMPQRRQQETPAPSVSADEYAEATENLLAQFGIDPTIAAADIEAAKATL